MASLLVVLSTIPLFAFVGKNFLPDDDASQYNVIVRTPEGTSLAATSLSLIHILFIVEARFDNGSSDLRPGMFAKARVLLPGGENAVFVPRSAILRDKTTDSNQVFAIENGKARLRVVVVGDADGGQVRIASGLTGNETVAVNHLSELFDGAAVESHN